MPVPSVPLSGVLISTLPGHGQLPFPGTGPITMTQLLAELIQAGQPTWSHSTSFPSSSGLSPATAGGTSLLHLAGSPYPKFTKHCICWRMHRCSWCSGPSPWRRQSNPFMFMTNAFRSQVRFSPSLVLQIHGHCIQMSWRLSHCWPQRLTLP